MTEEVLKVKVLVSPVPRGATGNFFCYVLPDNGAVTEVRIFQAPDLILKLLPDSYIILRGHTWRTTNDDIKWLRLTAKTSVSSLCAPSCRIYRYVIETFEHDHHAQLLKTYDFHYIFCTAAVLLILNILFLYT